MKKFYPVLVTVICLALFVGLTGCGEDSELFASFRAQNFKPHINSVSLQSGESDDKEFSFVVRMGMLEREKRKKQVLVTRVFDPLSKPGRKNLINVGRVTFSLEYWGSVVEFLLDWEPGDFFERKDPNVSVDYAINPPFVGDTGLTYLNVDVLADFSIPPEDRFTVEKGDLLTLKFRAIRSGTIPLNFSTRYGEVYDTDGELITGIGWYGGIVSIEYD